MSDGNQNKPDAGEQTDPPGERQAPTKSSPGFADQPTLGPGDFPQPPPSTPKQTPPPSPPPPPRDGSGVSRPGSWGERPSQQRAVTDSWDRPPPGSSGALGSDPDRGEAPTIAPWESSFGGQRITAGKHIGPYPIERELGRGGMGVVYLAKDPNLNRRVAIKVLPDVFAQHPERAARFKREAQLLASLNHPNVAAIYGLQEHEGHHYIVMEYVPGDTLSERLANGPIELDDAVHVCAQIAEGLEAAHERSVIHRDLKPGNIKITPEGVVKVLDFGLAKAAPEGSTLGDPESSQTGSLENTQEGVILGTAAYMSPEQARGRALDKRTDVWSFGCVLYETLTGRPPFQADTLSDTIALILRSEPDWSALPVNTPERVRELLRRALQKDPKRRLRDLGDARIELHDAYSAMSGSDIAVPQDTTHLATEPAGPSPWLAQLPWIVAGVAVALAATLLAVVIKGGMESGGGRAGGAPLVRFELAPPGGSLFDASGGAGGTAISPDGTLVVFRARDESGARLYLRHMDAFEAEPLPGTEGGRMPFFSADGASVGFFTPGRLRRVGLAGGQRVVQDIAAVADEVAGAAWLPDDRVIYASLGASPGLYAVSAGGTPERLTTPDRGEGEVAHLWPHVLPGGRTVLFASSSGDGPRGSSVRALRLDGKSEPVTVVTAASAPRYAAGHLLFAREDDLYAVRFDADRVQTAGTPELMINGVLASGDLGGAEFALASTGTLVYLPGGITRSVNTLVLVERGGGVSDLITSEQVQASPRFDPSDPSRILVSSGQRDGGWVFEPGATELRPFTRLSLPGRIVSYAFRPDGGGVTVTLNAGTEWILSTLASDGATMLAGEEYRAGRPMVAASWRPEFGTELAAVETSSESGRRAVVRIASRERSPLFTSEADEHSPVFSPDGNWVAYVSDRTGVPRVYLRSYPDSGTVVDVSQGPGVEPVWNHASWSAAGGELFFRDGDAIRKVDVVVQGGRALVPSPSPVVRGRYRLGRDGVAAWDASPDGRSFVMIRDGQTEARAERMHVVLGFNRQVEGRLARRAD